MVVFAAKTPPQTPPHKGEGLHLRRRFAQIYPFHFRSVCDMRHAFVRISPSPLWGGVGAGSFYLNPRPPL